MKNATRAAWCGVWLLCALIIAASIDNIPDPPAEKSGTTNVRAAGAMGSLHAPAGGGTEKLCPRSGSARCRSLECVEADH